MGVQILASYLMFFSMCFFFSGGKSDNSCKFKINSLFILDT